MSDVFNHELDAFECERTDEDDFQGYNESYKEFKGVKDRLHYHEKTSFEDIKSETPKAYLFNIWGKDYWVPKSICKNMDIKKRTVYIHTRTFESIKRRSQ